jgi:hypothetical protein
MASHEVLKENGKNCTLSWLSYGNCLLGSILFDFLLKGETINVAYYIQMLKNYNVHFMTRANEKIVSFNMTMQDITLHV